MAEMVKLKSSQADVFVVEKEVACMSTLIKNMIDDTGCDEEIPLPNVKTAILSKVLRSFEIFFRVARHILTPGFLR